MKALDKIMGNLNEFHGIWRVLPSVALTEIIAQSGFDFQILDCEHGAYDFTTLTNDIIACELNGCSPFIRVSGINKVEVQRCLDIGAHGIVFPSLATVEDFKTASELMSYAPKGIRGFNPFVRSNKFGINDGQNGFRPLCVVILETLSAVDQLEAILSIEGIDLFYIGAYDLSAQLNCLGVMDSPKLIEVIDKIIKECTKCNKAVSLMIHSKSQHEEALLKGVKGFVHAVDSIKIKTAFTDYLNKF